MADPRTALDGLIKAKEVLLVAKNEYLKKNDFEGLREYLGEKAVNMNNLKAMLSPFWHRK
eukprot:scaffold4782_cov58-Attheya_sp.AAC.1